MYYAPKHRSALKRGPLRNRIVGVAFAASATLATGVGLSAPAQAAGSVWDKVAACESGGNWSINTGNGFFGGLQFTPSTWKAFGGGQHAASANRASKATQIAIAKRVLVTQGPGAWPVCSKRAGLTRANGGAATAAPARSAKVSRSTARAVPVGGKLAVDGLMGPKTISATQRWIGTARSGVFHSQTVKALQRKVGAGADGVIGPRTMRALQTKIGARRDGTRHLNAATVVAVQKYLNRR